MAECAPCRRERKKKVGTATERCEVCLDRICRHHLRHEQEKVMCADDAREARRKASRAIREREGTP